MFKIIWGVIAFLIIKGLFSQSEGLDSFFQMTSFFIIFIIVIILLIFVFTSDYRREKSANQQAKLERRKILLKRKRMELRNKQHKFISDIAYSYSAKLLVRKRILVRIDDYGDKDYSAWNKEIQYFLDNKVFPMPEHLSFHENGLNQSEAFEIVNSVVTRKELASRNDETEFDTSMNGYEYEHYCANILSANGWQAKVSSASNDQGIDVTAIKGVFKVAIQCKKHAKPVGNKAVQEVVAGKQYYDLDYGVVVSENGYTDSAKRLAQRTNTFLLHHSQIEELEIILQNSLNR